jgi:signal transduction histidine kinase
MERRGIGLGGRLLLFSSVLLAIPWLGYRYIGEMKEFLLKGQQEAQLLAVGAVATVLHDRYDLFEPSDTPLNSSLESRALYVYPLDNELQTDGYATDWDALLERRKHFGPESTLYTDTGKLAASLSFSLVLGARNEYIHGFLQVNDQLLVYRHPQYRRLDNSDHVRLAMIGPEGQLRRLVLVTEGQGTTSSYEVQENWRYPTTGQPLYQLNGVWRERSGGYDLEFRFPSAWLGDQQRMLLSVVDVDEAERRVIRAVVGTLPKQWSGALNRVIVRSPDLERILQGLGRSDASICVVDRYRRVRAVLGGQEAEGNLCADTDRISKDLVKDALEGRQNVHHREDDTNGDTLIVAAHPIYADDEVIGAVLLEKNSARILELQRDALNHVALATFLVLLLVVAGLLMFGAWLAFRIRRLQREAAHAIDADGRVLSGTLQSDHAACDDLGALSRGMSDLLRRLQRYTGFLETVPRTLRHEILNPVNTISMSLQKLAQNDDARIDGASVKAAQQASRQLERIVNGLTEAANIDAALTEDASELLDLATVVHEYVENSSLLHPDRSLVYEGPDSGVMVWGSDLRIAQLLDKLKDNALDFSRVESRILVVLQTLDGQAELSVLNEGPPIPESVLQSLFVGMASNRAVTDGQPHLGIGLYIAKHIAMHLGGELEVRNRDDVSGVRVTLYVPLATAP